MRVVVEGEAVVTQGGVVEVIGLTPVGEGEDRTMLVKINKTNVVTKKMAMVWYLLPSWGKMSSGVSHFVRDCNYN